MGKIDKNLMVHFLHHPKDQTNVCICVHSKVEVERGKRKKLGPE